MIMKNLNKIYILEIGFIVLITLLNFLVSRQFFSFSAYIIISLIAVLYFFPLRIILWMQNLQLHKDKIISVVSSLLISVAIVFSVLMRYADDAPMMRTVFHVLAFMNIALLFLVYFKWPDIKVIRIHLVLILLFSTLFYS